MSVEEIYTVVSDEVTREIVGFCKKPRTTDEVVGRLMEYYAEVGYRVPEEYEMRNRTAVRLAKLEDVGALAFDENAGIWSSEQIALKVLAKYFGV